MKPVHRAILLTWLIAGTLDITSAFIHQFILTGKIFWKMFNYIAGGILGLDVSMTGGLGVVLLGLFIHYFIAFSFTLFFFLIYERFRIFTLNKYLVGILYGLLVWFVMNRLILPFTKLPPRPFNPQNAIIGAVILIFMIGLPISIGAYNYYSKAKNNSQHGDK